MPRTRLTERARLERRIAEMKEREANISDRIARTKLGQDLADVQLLIQRAQERLAGMRQEEAETELPLSDADKTAMRETAAALDLSHAVAEAARAGPPTPRTTDDTLPDLPAALDVRNRRAAE